MLNDTRSKPPTGDSAVGQGTAKDLRSNARSERTRQEIGKRLKALRQSKGLSLREVATIAGLSPSFIGLVERGETEIAISRLIRLADAYGCLVADLLADVHEQRVEYVPISEALSVATNEPGIEILYLASPSWSMEPFLIRIAPGAKLEGLRHDAEEFVHCIGGSPALRVADQLQTMAQGDTIFVPRLAEHAYLNPSDEPAILVGAVHRWSPPPLKTERSMP